MKELIDAAVNAASRSGVQAAVVLIGDGNGAVPEGVDEELHNKLEAMEQALAHEREQVAQLKAIASAAAQGAIPQAPDPAVAANVGALQQQLAEARAEAKQTQEALEQTQEALKEALKAAQTSAAPQATGGAEQPADVQPFDSYGLEHLGLDSKCEKLVRKHYETIGALREAFAALDTEEKAQEWAKMVRLKKDWVAAVGIALLRNYPSSSSGQPAAAPAAGTGGGAKDVPEGHQDQGWMERVNAARSKEARLTEVEATITKLREEAAAAHPDAMTQADGEAAPTLKLDALPPEVRNQILHQEGTYNVVRGQLIACMWCSNLQPPQKGSQVQTVDDSLKAAGLEKLASKPA